MSVEVETVTYGLSGWSSTSGLMLRDYFAGQALVGLLANPKETGTVKAIAETAYDIADVLLAERARRDAAEKGE